MKQVEIKTLAKSPSGIKGLDEITNGGYPKGRPTLICGSAGCGKTLMAMQFLVKGCTEYNEPGVFMSFEETAKDLAENVKSLGFDIDKLITTKKMKIDHVQVDRSEIEETGEYDLEGLFVRLNYAIDSIGAKRVVLDTIETLFGGLDNVGILRSEIRRLFHWLKQKGVTTIITGERGEQSLTRQGLEEYVSDCVILLDLRVNEQVATRRLRIVKYRGSTHGTNEYPFLIDEEGFSVLPITSLKFEHSISKEIISLGHPYLDGLFQHNGVFRGNNILLTGSAGTLKTIFAAHFAMAAIKRNEKVLYFSFEESPEQLIRNMASVGINFKPHVKSGLLTIHSSRPALQGLEMHLLLFHKLIEQIKPTTVIIDPVSSLVNIGENIEIKSMLVRLMDTFKLHRVNAMVISLVSVENIFEKDFTIDAVSSLADTWMKLSNTERDGERKRQLQIVKSRGTGHSNQMQIFDVNNKGLYFEKN